MTLTFRARVAGSDDNHHQISATRYRRDKTLRLLFGGERRDDFFEARITVPPWASRLHRRVTAIRGLRRAEEFRNQIKLGPAQECVEKAGFSFEKDDVSPH